MSTLKTREQVQAIADEIASPGSAVGMDPVYVHAVILDYLRRIEQRLGRLEVEVEELKNR